MSHAHSHTHGHAHSHAPANYNRAFAWGVALNAIYIIIEVVFGVLGNSLALLADAGHNLSDVLGLVLAWGAHYLTQIKPSERRTYGWRSTSIWAALLNSLILLVAIGGIVWEALQRYGEAHAGETLSIDGTMMIWVAGVGVVVNTLTAFLFFKGRKGDLNIRGAFLHMAADAGISLGVVIAGVSIYLTGLTWIDSATSLAVALIIFIGTWGLLRDSVNLALQAVPEGIELSEVRAYLAQLPEVENVHDLHIWAMSTTETALTAHLVKPSLTNDDALLAEAQHALHERFGIEHVTLQIERNATAADCRQWPADVV